MVVFSDLLSYKRDTHDYLSKNLCLCFVNKMKQEFQTQLCPMFKFVFCKCMQIGVYFIKLCVICM